MHPVPALLVSALFCLAYFPEGGQSVPAYGSTYGVGRKDEGVILKKRNDEADRLLQELEAEKKRLRTELGINYEVKPAGNIRPPHQTSDYKKQPDYSKVPVSLGGTKNVGNPSKGGAVYSSAAAGVGRPTPNPLETGERLLEQIEMEKRKIRAELGIPNDQSYGKGQNNPNVQYTTGAYSTPYSLSGFDSNGVNPTGASGAGRSRQSSQFNHGPPPERPEISPSPAPRGFPLPTPPTQRKFPLPSPYEPAPASGLPLSRPHKGFPMSAMTQQGGSGFTGEPNIAAMLSHAPFKAKGVYGGVKYKIGFNSESDSDESNTKYIRSHKNKKLKIKIGKKTEDGTPISNHAREAIKDHLEGQVLGGTYRPIPA